MKKKIFTLLFLLLTNFCSVYANNAIDEYTQIINNSTENNEMLPPTYCLRGIQFKLQKEYNLAIQDFEKALSYKTDANKKFFNIVYQELADTQYLLNDYQGAIKNISNAISIKPDDSYYYYFRAKQYLAIKDYTNAVKDATKSIQLKYKNPKAFKLRGLAEYKIGNIESAKKDLEYAKQQFFEIGNYDEYKSLISILNSLYQKDQNEIKESLEQLNKTLYTNINDNVHVILY